MSRNFTDTATDRVTVSDSASLDCTTGITIMFWAKSDSWTSTQFRHVVSKLDAYFVRAQNANIQFCVYTPTIVVNTSTKTLTDGNWYHITGKYDGSDVYTVVYDPSDGSTTTASTSDTGSITTNASDLHIGTYDTFDASFDFNGDIANVKIWDTALAAGEIENEVFRYWPVTKRSNLVLHTPLGLASTEPDYSGSGNTGTVTGATVSANPPYILKPNRLRPSLALGGAAGTNTIIIVPTGPPR